MLMVNINRMYPKQTRTMLLLSPPLQKKYSYVRANPKIHSITVLQISEEVLNVILWT